MKVRRGDIFKLDLEPTKGREQQSKRPVLVVSPDEYNAHFAPLVCPITTGGAYARDKGFAVPISGGKTSGAVLCNQARTLDLDARGAKRVERIDDDVLRAVLYVLQDIVAD
jgi:mRNA interferase ChpB